MSKIYYSIIRSRQLLILIKQTLSEVTFRASLTVRVSMISTTAVLMQCWEVKFYKSFQLSTMELNRKHINSSDILMRTKWKLLSWKTIVEWDKKKEKVKLSVA